MVQESWRKDSDCDDRCDVDGVSEGESKMEMTWQGGGFQSDLEERYPKYYPCIKHGWRFFLTGKGVPTVIAAFKLMLREFFFRSTVSTVKFYCR